MLRCGLFGLLMASLLASASCTDFAPPAALERPIVIAITAEPPTVGLGQSTRLELIVASPDGQQPVNAAVWSITPTIPGVPALGSITSNVDGSATYTAPTTLPALPPDANPVDTVAVDLPIGGVDSHSVKVVPVVNLPQPPKNPVVTDLLLDNVAVTNAIVLKAGVRAELSAVIAPVAGEKAAFAWYASAGKIEQYLSNPTSIVAETPGNGWLFFVVRDGTLGSAWRKMPIVVQ
ncbi:MAG TPA: hypothetical protein PLF40_29180 [Kofleriaceae bacterium]|nr:hypothetical protein [Kofleriaceae bacterium]